MRKTIHMLKWLLAAWIPVLVLAGCSSDQASKKVVQKTIAKITPEQRLELVSYKTKSVARSGEDDKDKAFYIIGDRKMLVSFMADVRAGIDLKDFNPKKDIVLRRKDRSAVIKLPDPVVFTCDVPIDSVNFEKGEKGFLRPKFTHDEVVHVASLGKQNILKEIENEQRYPILKDAKENARRTFTSLFNALGYTKVEVVFPSDEKAKENAKVKTKEEQAVGAAPSDDAEESDSENIQAVG